jgi:hypothetical protein
LIQFQFETFNVAIQTVLFLYSSDRTTGRCQTISKDYFLPHAIKRLNLSRLRPKGSAVKEKLVSVVVGFEVELQKTTTTTTD